MARGRGDKVAALRAHASQTAGAIEVVGPDRYAAWVAREDFRLAARQGSDRMSSAVSPPGAGTVAAASASASAGGG